MIIFITIPIEIGRVKRSKIVTRKNIGFLFDDLLCMNAKETVLSIFYIIWLNTFDRKYIIFGIYLLEYISIILI